MDKLTNKRLAIIATVLLGINLIIQTILFFSGTSSEHLDGTFIEPGSVELITIKLKGLLFSVPVIGFIFGLIIGIFISKKVSYFNRVLKGFLIALSIIYALLTPVGLKAVF